MDFSLSLAAIGKKLYTSFLHTFYPTLCLHCQTLLPPGSLVLCSGCASLLELINLHERCPTCFNLLSEEDSLPCNQCLDYPSLYVRMAAAFNYEGPAQSLVKHLKYGNQPYLAKGMAAFLVAQLDCLQWPLPDILVPVPLSLIHWLDRGYNQSELMAQEIGRLLNRPVWQAIKRYSGDYSQAALNLEQRKALSGHRFRRNPSYLLQGKIVLVIDDVMTSGLTLQRCAEVLNSGEPAALYALTFCRTFRQS